MKIGLCLGGGGPRGYAHLGVIRALNDAGIHIDLINGTSIGAVVGAAYALHGDVGVVNELVKKTTRSVNVKTFNIFRFSLEGRTFLHEWLTGALCGVATMRRSVQSHRSNLRALSILYGDKSFSDCLIPFSSVATNLNTGKPVVIKRGKLIDGVLPSLSLPGIFPPVRRGNHLLIDGFVLSNIPVKEIRAEGADFVISVELAVPDEFGYDNGLGLINYVEAAKQRRIERWQIAESDFHLRINFAKYESNEYGHFAEASELGYRVARRHMPQLLEKLGKHG